MIRTLKRTWVWSPYPHGEPEMVEDHRKDCERIVAAFAEVDEIIHIDTAYAAWAEYSEGLYAGWMMLPDSSGEIRASLIRSGRITQSGATATDP
jgi:hypothetical protein